MSSAVQTLTQIKRPVLWQLMCTAAPDIARFISQLDSARVSDERSPVFSQQWPIYPACSQRILFLL
jgi:hypothetical protein